MASIRKITPTYRAADGTIRESKPVWQAQYRDDDGKQHRRNFDRKVDAQAWLDEVTTARNTGTYADPRAGRATVGQVAEGWLTNPRWSETTSERNAGIVRVHILPRWGKTPVAKVTHDGVQEWVNELVESGLSGGSVRKVHGALSGILGRAVKSKRVAVNAAKDVDLPKQALKARRYLSAREVEDLAGAAGDDRDVVLVLAYCGLRFGELAALRVRQVDQLRRRLTVESSVTEVNGKLVWSTPKDHQRRTVPYPPFLDAAITARIAGKGLDDLVFTSHRGETLRVRNVRRDWFDAAARDTVGAVTPHELRHTCASLAVAGGASVLALQRMLGHAKASMTLDVYADLFDTDLDDVAANLARLREHSLSTVDDPTNVVSLVVGL